MVVSECIYWVVFVLINFLPYREIPHPFISIMSDQGLSAPPSFLPTPGEPVILWKDWKKLFLTYILATGADKHGPVRKQAILLHNLGVEGRRLYENLPEVSLGVGDGEPSNVYDMTMKMLDL